MLKLRQLGVEGRLTLFDAQVESGSRVHVIGPNGAGKSTLLTRLAGLLPGQGEVHLADNDMGKMACNKQARLRAYLCQQLTPVSLIPVFQYLALHQPALVGSSALETVIAMLCDSLQLTDKLGKSITKLSGGEWQRVRLAATLLQVWPSINPDSALLLLDEPMNSLDVAQQQALDRLIRQFCATGRIALISDHDLNHTLHHADQVWLMSESKVIALGKTADIMQADLLSSVYHVEFQLQFLAGRKWIMTAL